MPERMISAREFYSVQGEDRAFSASGRRLRLLGTAIAGLLGDTDGPPMTDVVIRSALDGSELRRIRPDSVSEFERTLADVLADLESFAAEDFADAWIDPPEA